MTDQSLAVLEQMRTEYGVRVDYLRAALEIAATNERRSMEESRGLGRSIRALRKMSGMTQKKLAELAGLERTSITNIEAGKQTLTAPAINRIAEAMGYEVQIRFVKRRPKGQP